MKNITCRTIGAGSEVARAAYIESVCLSTAWSEAQIADMPHYATYLCAFLNETLCGVASMYAVAGEAQIMNLAVLPEYRRNGVADALMQALFTAARERNCDIITLEVESGNEGAISLYKKHNFIVSGRRKGFYNGKDALNMEKKL